MPFMDFMKSQEKAGKFDECCKVFEEVLDANYIKGHYKKVGDCTYSWIWYYGTASFFGNEQGIAEVKVELDKLRSYILFARINGSASYLDDDIFANAFYNLSIDTIEGNFSIVKYGDNLPGVAICINHVPPISPADIFKDIEEGYRISTKDQVFNYLDGVLGGNLYEIRVDKSVLSKLNACASVPHNPLFGGHGF